MWPICAESAIKPQPTNHADSRHLLTDDLDDSEDIMKRQGDFFWPSE